MAVFINIALEYWNRKECGARYGPEDLTEGEWACLTSILEGKSRASAQEAQNDIQGQMNAYNQLRGGR